jgi:hypothetical protein
MKTALYARVSTALKHERLNLDTQLLPLREFCERRDWEIAEEYVDDISAVKWRPAYDRMLIDPAPADGSLASSSSSSIACSAAWTNSFAWCAISITGMSAWSAPTKASTATNQAPAEFCS